jgi:hypothetical protein
VEDASLALSTTATRFFYDERINQPKAETLRPASSIGGVMNSIGGPAFRRVVNRTHLRSGTIDIMPIQPPSTTGPTAGFSPFRAEPLTRLVPISSPISSLGITIVKENAGVSCRSGSKGSPGRIRTLQRHKIQRRGEWKCPIRKKSIFITSRICPS